MKKYTILFWVTTSLIFLTQSIGELVTFMNGSAQEGIMSLGYPAYFVAFLVVAKLLGGIVLMIPAFPSRIKEWAYAGFGFDFIAAFVSMWAVGGLNVTLVLPIIAFVLLWLSYTSYHKIKSQA